MVRSLPAVWETQVRSLGQEKDMANHSSNLAWKIPWTEEPGRLQSMESQRVRHNWVTSLFLHPNPIIIVLFFLLCLTFPLLCNALHCNKPINAKFGAASLSLVVQANWFRTVLEPDILECEVKWALESIATNKASGGDGIPVELFQILKDDAMKVLHSICQQIWKTQQCPHDWRRSVVIPIPKKGNAKDAQSESEVA